MNSGRVPGVSRVYEELSENNHRHNTVVQLSEEVRGKTFVDVLQFLYTGITPITDILYIILYLIYY